MTNYMYFFYDFTGKQFCSRKNYQPPFLMVVKSMLCPGTDPIIPHYITNVSNMQSQSQTPKFPQPNKPCLSKFLSCEITSCTVGTLMARFLTSIFKEFFVEKVNFFDKWQELIASQCIMAAHSGRVKIWKKVQFRDAALFASKDKI